MAHLLVVSNTLTQAAAADELPVLTLLPHEVTVVASDTDALTNAETQSDRHAGRHPGSDTDPYAERQSPCKYVQRPSADPDPGGNASPGTATDATAGTHTGELTD